MNTEEGGRSEFGGGGGGLKAGKGKYFPFKIIRQDRKGRYKREADISTIMEIFLREEKKKKKPLLNVKDSKESLFSYLPLKNYKIDRQKKIKKKNPTSPFIQCSWFTSHQKPISRQSWSSLPALTAL